MTRKDYQIIADAIREARELAGPDNTDKIYGIGMAQDRCRADAGAHSTKGSSND